MKYKILIMLFLFFQPVVPEDWPMYGQNPGQTWSASSSLSLDLEVKWKFDLPDPLSEFEWIFPPVIVDNKVYFANPGGVYCLDGDTGDLIFSWDYKLRPSRPLAVHKETLYIGGTCFNVNTGEVTWETDLGIISFMPLIYEKKVYILSMYGFDSLFDVRAPVTGYNANTIACLNEETGEIIWRFTTPQEAGALGTQIVTHIFTVPVIDSGRIYCALSRDHIARSICCLDAETGEELWVKEAGETENGFLQSIGRYLTINNGNLICTISKHIYCLDGETGETLWTYLPDTTVGEAPMATQEDILVVRGINVVSAVDTINGTLLWETSVPGMETDLALADGTVLVGSQDGHLYILDGKTGQIKGKYDFQEEVYSPVVASGKVFITSRSTLYALGEKDKEYYEFVIVGILVITVLGFVIYLKKKR